MSTAYGDLQDAILNGLQPVWNNEVPVRQAITDVVAKVNYVLKQAPQYR
jgi:hypothetical protein